MPILSAQSIRRLTTHPDPTTNLPLITPFHERTVHRGKSYGLSACSYDCRIAEDLILAPHTAALASTIERFALPHNVCASVLDKSTYARVFVSAFNTHFDPGFIGYATIELVNHASTLITYQAGDPLCQFKFEWLDEPTVLPYTGKYNHQAAGPQPARYEAGRTDDCRFDTRQRCIVHGSPRDYHGSAFDPDFLDTCFDSSRGRFGRQPPK